MSRRSRREGAAGVAGQGRSGRTDAVGLLRIVGGHLKGRRVPVPDIPGVRPTSDRVRESIFNILGQHFNGERVLDAFAGSGALGFEALSRGAGSVVAIESNPKVARALLDAAAGLGLSSSIRVVTGDAVLWSAGKSTDSFDLIFADPPYASDVGASFLAALVAGRRLAPGARIALERPSKLPVIFAPAGVKWVRTATYGGTAIDLFEASAEPAPGRP